MQCPHCHAELNGEDDAFCANCGSPLTVPEGMIYLTPSVSASPQATLTGEPYRTPDGPSAQKPFTITQKLAVVGLSLVMACLVVAIGVLGYATLKGSHSATSALPDIVPVEINDNTFPDQAFRNYVAAHFDSDADGTLSPNELAAVEHIGQVDESSGTIIDPGVAALGIETLDGIRYFANLKSLLCSGNNLHIIDLTENERIEYLDCRNNPDTSIVVPSPVVPPKIEKDPDATMQEGRQDNPSSGNEDSSIEDKTDIEEGAKPSERSGGMVASAATQRYRENLYAGGTLEGAVDEAGNAIAVTFDGFRSVGAQTSSFLIKDGFVYYLDAPSFDRRATKTPVDLCRQALDGDGSDKEVLASLALDSSTFYCVGDSIYLNALASDGKAKSTAVRPVRVPVTGGGGQEIAAMRQIVGATDAYLYFLKAGDASVYRCNADLSGEVKMQDMAVIGTQTPAYGQCDDGSLWTVRSTSSAVHLSVVSAEGKSLVERDIEGASASAFTWSDGSKLYVPMAPESNSANTPSLKCVDLKTGKAEGAIGLLCNEVGSAVPLYVDEDVCYYQIDALPALETGVSDSEAKKGQNARSGAPSVGKATVFKQDRATGAVEAIATWAKGV